MERGKVISSSLFGLFDRLDFAAPWATSATRLVHGRGKEFSGFEHLTIEWYPPYVVIFLHRSLELEGLIKIREYFSQLKRPQIQGIFLQQRENGKVSWQTLQGVLPQSPFVVHEGHLQFLIKLGGDQNVGLFLDMRPLRSWLLQNAADKCILNLFSYTCSLSVAAAKGLAREVHNVDMKKTFLTWGRDNHKLNQCERHISYHPLDVLKSFGRFKRIGPFNLIIIDPPSHQEFFSLERHYARLLKRVGEWLSPHGTLVLVTNTPDITLEHFRTMAEEALGPFFQFICWGDRPTILLGSDPNFPVKVAFYNKTN
ncbi:MAG: class I SAM-dependent methyltransferase [Bdellovibrio sp.]|nr:class I SAM-dependent methyltransferase [Bdellovibrio sp.]